MKTMLILASLGTSALLAGPAEQPKPPRHEPPPVSYKVLPTPGAETFVYDQKPMGGRPILVAPEQAAALIERFKTNLARLGNPRMVVYVNRELVDEMSGLKLSGRTERVQSNSTEVKSDYKADPNAATATPPAVPTIPGGANVTIVGNVNGLNRNVPGSNNITTKTEKKTVENSYKNTERSAVTLADRQTVRDVERLFGRPLRMAGVNLADQRVATQLLGDKPAVSLSTEGEQARKDREALSKVADVALEILVSSRSVTVSELSGDRTYSIPDIQATAIRLSDARIMGQATSSDIIGKDRNAANIMRHFDVREITEATALALMEDMLLNVQ